MDERKRNVFYHPRSGSGSEYEQNVTKHLLTVLQNIDSSVTRQVWETLTGERFDKEGSDFEYETEITENATLGGDRYLVGLSRWGKSFEISDHKQKGARPDGLISYCDPESGKRTASIVLEVKTGDDALSQEQLSRYQEKFTISKSNCKSVQWTDVYQALERVDSRDDIEEFLIEQYLSYLRYEQLQGTVAEITANREDEEQSYLQKEIRIRHTPSVDGSDYAIRFWGTFYDPESESPDEAQTYTTRWMDQEVFSRLFDEIDKEIRAKIFVELIEQDRQGAEEEYPAYSRLREWASNGGFGGDSREYQGSSRQVFAETRDDDGGFPQMRFVDGGGKLRFGRMTADGGSNRFPLDLVDWEFEELMSDISDRQTREDAFVRGELEPLWNYYMQLE